MRKKKKKVTGKKSGGRGGLLNPNGPLVRYGSMALGYFVFAKPINDGIDKLAGGKLDTKIIAGAELGIGSLLAFKKGKRSLVTTVAGGVMIGAGAKRALAAFGIGGFQDVRAVNGRHNARMRGYSDVKYINGTGGSNAMPGGMGMWGDVKVPLTMRPSINGYTYSQQMRKRA